MIDRLKLNGSAARRFRQSFYELYERGELSLNLLDEWAPLIARAVRKQSATVTEPPH